MVDSSMKLCRLFGLEVGNSKEEAENFVVDLAREAKCKKKIVSRSKAEMERHRLGPQPSESVSTRSRRRSS
ncbi:unnamed protein product [Linum trigynum]|uniref:Uncharacterized protein n=1 Tax=Linum trigynum TaxID=586398 RepID=A0AAV2EBL6_9ROSI